MQHIVQETVDYTIEREFLGDITIKDLVEQIIRSHIFPAFAQESALLQEESEAWEFL